MAPPTTRCAHGVLFSEQAALVGVVGEQLSAAHAAGAAVIVIATPAHREAFAAEMTRLGVDVAAATEDGSLLLLDAADTLDRLTPGGALQRRFFDEVIGGLVREALVRGPVQAFGEMVGLLWEDGRVAEAIELERFWEKLVEETSLSLLCAYPSVLVDEHEQAAELARVCDLHTVVLSEVPFERTWELPTDARAAARARKLVINALRAHGWAEDDLADARVVVAELVANVLQHGRPPFSLRVSIEGDKALLAMRDSAGPSGRQLQSFDAHAGRGLHLVETLSRWGVEEEPDGTVVWAALDHG